MDRLRYQHVLAAVADTPWAITREKLNAILAFLAIKAAGGDVDTQAAGFSFGRPRESAAQRVGPVAVIPIRGTIVHRGGGIEEASGLTSTEAISKMLGEALRDDTVTSVLLDINSPGGSVAGVEELADEIRVGRAQKRIEAIANAEAGSAAYWLGAQASALSVTPSGRVGSIGVFAAHEDMSKALEAEGVKVTLVHAGKFKVEGNAFEPLSDEARSSIQARVDAYYDKFVRQVAKGRGVPVATVRSGFGEGRMLLADHAVAAGMADRVETMTDALARLTRSKQGSSMPSSSSDAPRERGEQDHTDAAALRDLASHLRTRTGGKR